MVFYYSNLIHKERNMDNLMEITPKAAEQINQIMEDENNPDLKLRIFVAGGGCSGFQYGFTLDELTNADDFVIEMHGIKVLVDAMSAQYLQGATIDFTTSLQGSQFEIKNPNAKTTCGCGSSFTA